MVKKGQILATLDPTFASADLTQLQQKMTSVSAQRDRLQAEQAGQPYKPAAGDPYQALQASIYSQRRMEYQSALNDFDARIRSTQADMARLKQDVVLYGKRLALAEQVQKMHETLAKSGYGSKLNAVIAEDSTAALGTDSVSVLATAISTLPQRRRSGLLGVPALEFAFERSILSTRLAIGLHYLLSRMLWQQARSCSVA
jgi:multidrug resistance efflux pump